MRDIEITINNTEKELDYIQTNGYVLFFVDDHGEVILRSCANLHQLLDIKLDADTLLNKNIIEVFKSMETGGENGKTEKA